jgi:branched-chain amino acid transport system permease protein
MLALITILATWGVYALLGCGIVLIYRTRRVLNIAQGELAIMLAYCLATAIRSQLPLALALPASLAAGAATGMIVYWICLRRVMGEPPYVGLMVTVGLAIAVHGIMIIFFGGRFMTIDLPVTGSMQLWGTSVSKTDIFVLVGAWLCVGLVFLTYRLTKLGLLMRSVAENVTLSAQRGVNVDRIVGLSWVIAIMAAGAAGSFHGVRAVIALATSIIGIKALIGCLIGGMDSMRGVLIGAFLVAGSEFVASRYFETRYALLAPIILLLIVLVIRPWGLFGTAEEIHRV